MSWVMSQEMRRFGNQRWRLNPRKTHFKSKPVQSDSDTSSFYIKRNMKKKVHLHTLK
jgi:hypothetical protein